MRSMALRNRPSTRGHLVSQARSLVYLDFAPMGRLVVADASVCTGAASINGCDSSHLRVGPSKSLPLGVVLCLVPSWLQVGSQVLFVTLHCLVC